MGEGRRGLGPSTSGPGMGGRKEKEQESEEGRDNTSVQPRPLCLLAPELETRVRRDNLQGGAQSRGGVPEEGGDRLRPGNQEVLRGG